MYGIYHIAIEIMSNTSLGPALVGMNPADQKAIDKKMVEDLDGSKNEWVGMHIDSCGKGGFCRCLRV